MAVSEDLPYVWDDAIVDNGVTWSSPFDYIVTHGYTLTDTIDTSLVNEISLLRYGTTYHPLVATSEVTKSLSVNAVTLSEAFHIYPNRSFGVMLMLGNSHGGAINDVPDFEIFGEYRIIHNDGSSTHYNAGFGYVPNGRVAIGDVDLSHFALVPLINASDNQGNIVCTGVSLKEYREQYAAAAPCITHIGYQMYYKSDLNSSYYDSINCTLVGDVIAGVYNYEMNNSQYNDVKNRISSRRFAFIGSLYSNTYSYMEHIAYSVATTTITLPSIIGWPYGASGTHAPNVQRYQVTSTYDNVPMSGMVCINYDTAMSIINSVGLWVCDDPTTIENMHGVNTTDPGVYAPKINDQGVPVGAVQGGGLTPDQSPIRNQWDELNKQFPIGGGDAAGAVIINPNDPINYSDVTGQTTITPQSFENGDPELLPSTPTVSGLGVFSNYYALGSTEILAFNSFLWQANQSVIDDIINSLKLFGQNPINAIINLRLYPFNVGALAPSINPQEIVLGRVATGVNGLLLPAGSNTVLTLGSVYIPAKYNSFLDYSPYTSYCLYIPFVGTVQLNPNTYLNHTLTLRMVVDITTGKATAIIYCEDIPMQYVDGMIGVEIPVTSENMSETVNAIIKAVGDTAAAAITTGPAAAAFTAVGGAVNVAFSGVGIDKTGNVGAAASFSMPLVPYLIISSPTTKIPGNYAHTYGHICNESGALSSFKGFTVCDNVDTSGISTATAKEREEIKSALESGVIL